MTPRADQRKSSAFRAPEATRTGHHRRQAERRSCDRDMARYSQPGRTLSQGRQMKYTVIYETTSTGFSAYVPDLPGCVAAGSSRDEVERLIKSAVREHIRILRERDEPVPPATTEHGHVAVGG